MLLIEVTAIVALTGVLVRSRWAQLAALRDRAAALERERSPPRPGRPRRSGCGFPRNCSSSAAPEAHGSRARSRSQSPSLPWWPIPRWSATTAIRTSHPPRCPACCAPRAGNSSTARCCSPGSCCRLGDFRHRTSVTTFFGEPKRLRVVSAKLTAAALTGAAVGLLAEALGAATSAAALSEHHVPRIWSQPGVLRTAAAVPLLAAMYGLLGVGLGLLLPTQPPHWAWHSCGPSSSRELSLC